MVKPKYTDLSELRTYSTHLQNFAIKFTVFVVLGVCMYAILWGFLRLFHVENVHPSSSPIPYRPNDFKCWDKLNSFKIEQRGSFWVLQNYIRANRWLRCDESVTLATVGDPTSLDNLSALVERWKGPISLALYTPRTDFEAAISKINYLKICGSPLISEFVTFHFYFEGDHRPSVIPREDDGLLTDAEPLQRRCSAAWPRLRLNATNLYRTQKDLPFPINVGRNVARNAATTHFILSSDIQSYPSENLIPSFLAMVKKDEYFTRETNRSVFVLPAFEVEEGTRKPSNKTELLLMIKKRLAFNYNNQLRFSRPSLPKYENWLKAPTDESLRALYTTKRKEMWVPYYIGTNQDPYYDERLTWEGKCDRLTQAYSMCLLNFNYHVLNNAFLVRKRTKEQEMNTAQISITRAQMLIKNHIGPEINTLYGTKESCWLNAENIP